MHGLFFDFLEGKTVYLPQLIISILLFMVLFFGIGFILNMLLKTTWLMAIVYPFIVILVINKTPLINYFTKINRVFSMLGQHIVHLTPPDIIILTSGFIGSVIAGIVMKMLRKNGYQMF